MFQENIPVPEYEKNADCFKPKNFSAEDWVKTAKKAGMKYMVLTTRHHDGFCLFDSKASDFTSVKTAAKRDFVREFVSACRKENMKIGFYYSLIDWRLPAAYEGPFKNPRGWKNLVDTVHSQVEELCTNYGKIDILWYDGGFYINGRKTSKTTAENWRSEKLNAMVRKLQPDILINNRSILPEDFDTPEQHITASAPGRLWESCMTMNNHWGYFAADPLWKPAKQIVHTLTACAGGGGNFLLNVGPEPDGRIPLKSVRRLDEIGRWLKVNGEAVYGVDRSSLDTGTAGCAAERGKTIYIFVHWWPGSVIALPQVDIEIKNARILGSSHKVIIERKGRRLFLKNLPKRATDKLTTVIALEKKS